MCLKPQPLVSYHITLKNKDFGAKPFVHLGTLHICFLTLDEFLNLSATLSPVRYQTESKISAAEYRYQQI